MGKTISEKIIGNKAGATVEAGQIVEANVDYVMVNDVTGLPAFEQFEKLPKGTMPLKEKIVLIPDHYVPNKDVASAEQAKRMREFAKKYEIKNYFEVGRGGVCHQLMIEKGFVAPGRLIVGADSHTCSYGALGAFSTGIGSTEAAAVMAIGKLWLKVPDSIKITVNGKLDNYVYGKDIILHVIGDIGVEGALYKAMEYYGNTIENLSLSDRISISNMAIEAGGKAGIIPPDDKVFEYLQERIKGNYNPVYSDKDAYYIEDLKYDAADIPPTVSKPFLPSNTAPASEVDVKIDQAYLGSCTNGRIEDLRIAAEILKGRKINPEVRMLVVPASKEVFNQALKEGLIDIFEKADCFVCGPTCGACLGGYMGILADGEKCVATTNRNFIGRMGHKNSEVYLANPAVVAASALEGRIVDPREVL
ncbi:MAG: Isopropylmalate/citramalate isomerase large subunit [Candidatus Methanofastidiosum methylothiophilum]|uniref:3-isopropylmalate dehydratase large subunit n=1 Tax=Candidatus Methanofastidiosum methylothiophilum TaxID=1705564 RepID=A0A150IHU7_9EURY|nr:MAG: Isopropylmalate/citramalate isomerase large subunit [Candidatus Methanofastidiosum methylthiophilus]KYC48391.1 MAG: Isopropylmalate/citramalate isomerase large subunit [Candidatus Methanofastidiosum methylthiophilus]KYC48991.1 MAG: Isopropylmalate/citramalate isomerase large subunit [Candidatus Methanofastidiosum methylthiophilus]